MFNLEQMKMMAALKAAMSGTDSVVDMPDGTKVRVQRSDEPGVRAVMRGESDGFEGRMFDAAETTPASYPSYLPFVAGTPAVVGSMRGESRFATWFGSLDVDSTLAMLVAHSERGGWVQAPSKAPPIPLPGLKTVTFRKGGFERVLLVGAFGGFGTASLIDKAAEAVE